MRPRTEQILDYSPEGVQRIKLWMERMQSKGQKKYFEIFIDSIRVVQKTDNLNEFDEYLQWVDADTQLLRLSVYNTEKSHRSQNFVYATSNYFQERKNEQLMAIQQDCIERLTAELTLANKKIEELERAEKPAIENTELSSLLSLFGSMSANQPELAEKFSRLSSALKTEEKTRVMPESDYCLSTMMQEKVMEITCFLRKNPNYIDELHNIIISETIIIESSGVARGA